MGRRHLILTISTVIFLIIIGSLGIETTTTAQTMTVVPTRVVFLPFVSRAPVQNLVILPNYSTYTVDTFDDLVIVGEIQNNGNIGVTHIRLVTNLFNNSGQLIDTAIAYNFGWIDSPLSPGEKTCFSARFGTFDGWSYIKFESPTSILSTVSPLKNMAIFGDNGIYNPDTGSYKILGFVRNDNSTSVADVDVIATGYNNNNTVVGCRFTSSNNDNLVPGQSSSFEMMFFEWNRDRDYADVASYHLQVDGRLQ